MLAYAIGDTIGRSDIFQANLVEFFWSVDGREQVVLWDLVEILKDAVEKGSWEGTRAARFYSVIWRQKNLQSAR